MARYYGRPWTRYPSAVGSKDPTPLIDRSWVYRPDGRGRSEDLAPLLWHDGVGGVHQLRGTPNARHGRCFHLLGPLDLPALLENLIGRCRCDAGVAGDDL